jgi:hypothetical protein
MDDVPGPAEVHDDGHGAGREGFENYASTVVAKGRKHEHISQSHATEDLGMTKPATEGHSILDAKRSRELLEAFPFRTVTDHGKACQFPSQEGRCRTQSKITSLPRDQAADEDQLKYGAGLRPARVSGTDGATDAGLRVKKQFLAIRGKLGISLGRSGDDRCRVAVGGTSERQIPIQLPQVGD